MTTTPSVRLLRPADYRVMPWRNGRGTTVEIAREDNADGALLWRVSKADVVEPGPFSSFPGIDRILTLVEGAGFDLDFGQNGHVAPIEPFVPVHFSGDWTTEASNVRGPSRDLNVMVMRGHVSASVSIHRNGATSTALADRSLFLALQGDWTVRVGDASYELGEQETLDIIRRKSTVIQFAGTGVLVQIDLTPA